MAALLWASAPAFAQIEGYGKDATGGASGSVCVVTTSAESGTGSWDYCVSKGGNQTIEFAVSSATVRTTSHLKSNTTVDGCANGHNGVTLNMPADKDRQVVLEGPVSNVIVRCIRFQGSGPKKSGYTTENDLLALDGDGGLVSKVLIDRCTFFGSTDGALDITGSVSDVTVGWSLLYGTPLTQLIKYRTRQRISLHHNVYTANGERNPQIKGDARDIDFVSNVVYNQTITSDPAGNSFSPYGTLLWNAGSGSDSPGNVKANVRSSFFGGSNSRLEIDTESGASAAGIYIASDNLCSRGCPSSPASTPNAVPAAYAVTVTPVGCMVSDMLPSVGSPDRTTTEQTYIDAVAAALPTDCGSSQLLTVTKAGTGAGTVTSSPAGISCGSDCSEAYASGTSVSLTAAPASGSVFTGWSGACSGTGSCSITMDAAKSVTAAFTAASLSINDVTLDEGSSGSKSATFTVTLSTALAGAVTVNYATANGTATAGSDYTAASGTLTFAAGETSKTLTVSVAGDTAIENDETFSVTLSGATGVTLADAQGAGTITNDDFPALSINDVTVNEGNSGTTNAVFTVSLSATSPQTITVNYTSANGTATAGSDYTAVTGNLSFTAGQTTRTITVAVNGDTTVEADEAYVVNLLSPAKATLADAQGQGTIANDDVAALPTLSINDVSVAEGNSGTATASFTVSLSAASASTVTVAFATADGTATAGTDYVAQNGTLNFTAGQTGKTISITINGDIAVESNETFLVTLSSPSGATIVDAQGQGTITNDDATTPPSGGESVTWMNAVGVAVSGDVLTKTAPGVGGVWNAGAVSTRSIQSGDGYVEFSMSPAPGPLAAGLSHGDDGQSYADIDFGVFFWTNGIAYVSESGEWPASLGTYGTADRFRVAVEGGKVKYWKNGVLLYQSSRTPNYPLLLDAAIGSTGESVDNAVIGGAKLVKTPKIETVQWTRATNMAVSTNSITRTVAGGQLLWNAGAVSTRAIPSGDDGYVEFSASPAPVTAAAGLSNGDSSLSFADIDFAVFLWTNGTAYVYEGGQWTASLGTYATSDRFQVAVEAGKVKYRKNGVLIYQSLKTPTYPLLLDASVDTQGGAINNAFIAGTTLVDSQLKVENVQWTRASGVAVELNSITRTVAGGQLLWNAGAASSRAIPSGDGYVEFSARPTPVTAAAGLSNGDSSLSFADIDFAVFLWTNGTAYVYESGQWTASLGTYTTSDRFQVAVESGRVRYRKNGVLVYESLKMPAYPLLLDASVDTQGGAINNAVIAGSALE